MAATGWSYIVPYQPDMSRVLDELRRAVFHRGEYQRPMPELDFLEAVGLFQADEEERAEILLQCGLDALRQPLERLGPEGLPGWVESLYAAPVLENMEDLAVLQCLSSGGTHSILDIERVSPTPAAGAIFPPSEELLHRYFGTAEPARIAVAELQRRD